MLHSLPSDPSHASPVRDPTRTPDGEDLSTEPVAPRSGVAPRVTVRPSVARVERLRRLVLEVRVAALQRELERARERRAAVIEHYEHLVDAEEPSKDEPVFSWRRRR